jgi:hypothetical protein
VDNKNEKRYFSKVTLHLSILNTLIQENLLHTNNIIMDCAGFKIILSYLVCWLPAHCALQHPFLAPLVLDQ